MKHLFFLFALILGSLASAGDLHTFLLNNCRTESGLVVSVDSDWITLIDLKGQERRLETDKVNAVYIFTYLDNPLPGVSGGADLAQSLKRVKVQGNSDDDTDDQEEFLGWPVRFVESLFMFFDIQGNVRVYDRDRILRVRPVDSVPEIRFANARPASLDLRGLSTQCPDLRETGANPLTPTRILSDKIKVDQYLSDMAHGYQDLLNFQERTYLYARPFLFPKKTRTTFYYREPAVERQLDYSIATQWSTGTPFHFQSYNRIGAQPMEFTPAAMPVFGFRSDLKAHIFHAHFSGDLRGFAGGSRIFGQEYVFDTEKYGGRTEVQTGFNYLILMGADYGPFSLSAGYFYPVYYVRAEKANREVLASRRNYLLRAMWTTPRWRFRGVVAPVHFDANADFDQAVIVGPFGKQFLSSMVFDGYFWRVGADFDWSRSREINMDLMLTKADYRETYNGAAQSYQFAKYAGVISVRQDFGDYVGLRLTGTWFHFENHSSLESGIINEEHNDFVPGGTLEFIF